MMFIREEWGVFCRFGIVVGYVGGEEIFFVDDECDFVFDDCEFWDFGINF